MKFFRFLKNGDLHLPPETKVIPLKDFSTLISSQEILKKAKKEAADRKEKSLLESEEIKKKAEKDGFEAGLEKWNEQLIHLENELRKIREDVEKAIVPLVISAAKKIVGKTLEAKPETFVDIVATALKPVLQHKRVTIYVNKNDFEMLESHRPEIKSLFEHLESLSIGVRDDIEAGGCLIETEAGIINAELKNQWDALEKAFSAIFKKENLKHS